jgi:hypothetical protein
VNNDRNYIGRTSETNILLKELSSTLENNDVHTLIYVEGPQGIGKKTLLKQAWNSPLLQLPKILRVPILCNKTTSGKSFLNDISDYLTCNEQTFAPAITSFRKDFSQSLRENTETAAIVDNKEEIPLNDDMLIDLWVECFFRHFIRQPDNSKGLQILFEFYDFENLPIPFKELVFRLLINPLADQKANPGIRFYLTGETPISELKSYANGWDIFAESLLEIKLAPFTENEVLQWVTEQDHPKDITTRLYQESKGIPGNLYTLADKIVDEEHSDDWLTQAETLLKDFKSEQQIMLCQAALLPIISATNLELFVTPDHALKLMQLLPGNRRLNLRQTDSGLRLPKEIQKSLQVWYQKNHPERYRLDTIKAASFQQVAALLPNTKDREVFKTLYNFNYFNHSVLSEIYGDAQATLLMDYVEKRHHLFEHTKDNHRISPSTRKILDSFYDATSYKTDNDEIQRINMAWQKKRDDILDGKNKTEERINKQEDSINKLKKEIRTIQADLTDRKDRLERMKQRYENRPQQRTLHSGKVGGSALMLITGIALLYIGIFFSDTLPLFYAIIGLLLTFASVFFAKHLRPQTTPHNAHRTPLNTEAAEKSMQFLTLKKNQLQVKLGAFTSNIQRYKNEIRDLEAQLREPYS